MILWNMENKGKYLFYEPRRFVDVFYHFDPPPRGGFFIAGIKMSA